MADLLSSPEANGPLSGNLPAGNGEISPKLGLARGREPFVTKF